MKDPARQAKVRNSNTAKVYKQQLPVAMANLKTLSDNGVPIVFGTDSGVPTRFMGYFEHLELKMMADADSRQNKSFNPRQRRLQSVWDLKILENEGRLFCGLYYTRC